ncbi:MAG: hypothetical protein GH144_10150 [Clostridia bacterium]|nr:hypothetical protein [Clostridia bacterium]
MLVYGAQYYRTPNPPQSEWAKDLRNMKQLGFNTVKFWAMWNHMHPAPGEFDFSHFDRLFELAAENELQVVISLIIENAPYWLVQKYPYTRYVAHDGVRIDLIARPNTPGGGWPGLCLDNKEVRDEATKFMRALAKRYEDHPSLYGYDVWDEAFFEPPGYFGKERRYCYCSASVETFRRWLKERYQTIENLSDNWYRRYTDWEQVIPPRFLGGYPDWLDWLKFRLVNHKNLMHWRVASLREGDRKHKMLSHGIAGSLGELPYRLNDDWFNADEVEQWGLSTFPYWSYPQVEKKSDPVKYFMWVDVTRSSARGKTIWQEELQGGHVQSGNAVAPGGIRRSRTPTLGDYRIWNWASLMCGCKGVLYWQWRPELLGPESPGFGLCDLDGSPTKRTKEAAWFAHFAKDNAELEDAKLVKGDLAIAMVNESQLFCFAAEGNTDFYAHSLQGVYRALWEINVQVDFAKPDDFGNYKLLYLPFPLMLEKETADKIKTYVEEGGILVSEACPAHFTDHGYCSFKVPGSGLDKVFGAVQKGVDSEEGLSLYWQGFSVPTILHQEKFSPEAGKPCGFYPDGSIGIVENRFGKGRTLLIGTYPGLTYYRKNTAEAASFIRNVLNFAGITQHICTSNNEVKVRFFKNEKAHYIYLLNIGNKDKENIQIVLSNKLGRFNKAKDMVKKGERYEVKEGIFYISLEREQGTVLKLE